LRQLGFEHVDLLERSQAETTRLRAENAELVSTQALEMNRADSAIQALTASRDAFLKENGRLKNELLALSAENAMLLDRRPRELTAARLKATPKPRAGEYATTCTAENTSMLGDSYAQFANGSKQGVGR
jgi:hypothetical protein